MPRKDTSRQSRVDAYVQGVFLYRHGRYEQAAEALEPLRDGDDLIGRLARYYQGMANRAVGMEALRQSQFDKAERHLRLAFDALGSQADLGCYLAGIYARTGRYEQCLLQTEREASQQSADADVWRRLAQAQWRCGRRAQAYLTLRQALRKLRDEPLLHLQLGLFHAADGELGLAQKHLETCARLDSANAQAHYYLALVLAALGQPLPAARGFQRSLELCPFDLVAAYQLSLAARAAAQQGAEVSVRLPEPTAALTGSQVRQLARYVTREPHLIEAFLALPPSEADEELFDLLSAVLAVALAEHPGYADLHYEASRVQERLGRREEALEAARRCLEINPRYVQALVHMGRLHAAAGQCRKAVDYLDKAIAAGADWPDVHCLAGEMNRSINRLDEARLHLRRALELNAGYGRASELLGSLAA